jgi:anti-sigma factor (TIGR02949 family)
MSKQQIDCEQALKKIFEFIDHELGDDERASMQHHLHTCKSCFSRMEFEQRLKQKISGLLDGQASASVSERINGLLKSF